MLLVQTNATYGSRLRRLIPYQAAIESCVIVLLASLLLWKGIIPGWRTLNTDFPNYYVVARLIHEHYCLDRIYDWIWFQRAADHLGIGRQLVGFLGLTPFSAFPMLPLSWLPALEAKRIWIVCNMGLLAASIHLLSRATGLSLRRAWMIALCAVIPLRTDFLFGQMHLLVLVLLAAAYVSHMRKRQMLSGSLIALAAALKIYPIFFCVYFIAKKRWTAAAAALVGTVCCFLLSYMIVGRPAMNIYLSQQLPRTLQGESGDPFGSSTTSSAAMFHRLFLSEPELNPHPAVASPILYAALYPLWQALLAGIVLARLRLGFRPDHRETIEWSLFTALLLFLSSAPASYHFVVLIAIAIPTVAVLVKMRRVRAAGVFFILYLAACNLRNLTSSGWTRGLPMPLLYLKLWVGVALLAFYVMVLNVQEMDPELEDECSRFCFKGKAAALVLSLWLVGSYSAWRHFVGSGADFSHRIALPDKAYLRIRPVYEGDHLFYVGMLRDGYRWLSAAPYAPRPNDAGPSTGDGLSVAVASSGQAAWVEEDAGGPRLVRVSLAGAELQACQIEDGQEPVLLSDGSILAFLRENHGRGSLWVADPRRCGPDGELAGVQRMSPASYDVRTVGAGASHELVFSAEVAGRESIYSILPGGSPQLLVSGNGPLESPAVAPGGKLLVMRKLLKARWQLFSVDRSSGSERQLTFGDCNAYTPSWKDEDTIVYATDCGRGLGLTALAWVRISR
jgi:hypothetical protein